MTDATTIDEAKMSARGRDLRKAVTGQTIDAVRSYIAAGLPTTEMADHLWQGHLMLMADAAALLAKTSRLDPAPNMETAEDRGEYLVKIERLLREAFGLPDAAPYPGACLDCGAGLAQVMGDCPACGAVGI